MYRVTREVVLKVLLKSNLKFAFLLTKMELLHLCQHNLKGNLMCHIEALEHNTLAIYPESYPVEPRGFSEK